MSGDQGRVSNARQEEILSQLVQHRLQMIIGRWRKYVKGSRKDSKCQSRGNNCAI